jgi:hypothetical protein
MFMFSEHQTTYLDLTHFQTLGCLRPQHSYLPLLPHVHFGSLLNLHKTLIQLFPLFRFLHSLTNPTIRKTPLPDQPPPTFRTGEMGPLVVLFSSLAMIMFTGTFIIIDQVMFSERQMTFGPNTRENCFFSIISTPFSSCGGRGSQPLAEPGIVYNSIIHIRKI